MNVVVLVPLSENLDGHRRSAWKYSREHLQSEHPSWAIEIGYSPEQPWSKGLALADARRYVEADVFVVHDADVMVEPDALERSVALVAAGERWVVPHGDVHRLSESYTASVLAGAPISLPRPDQLDRQPYAGYSGGGITVVSAATWDECPVDPRFTGWGCEDEAWAWALGCLYGPPVHGNAALWHLFHPHPAPGARHGTNPASHLLWRSYRAHRNRPDLMRAILADARAAATV